MQQPQTFQAVGQAGNRHIDFAHAKIQALDQRAIGERREGGHGCHAAGGSEQTAPARIEFRSLQTLPEGMKKGV